MSIPKRWMRASHTLAGRRDRSVLTVRLGGGTLAAMTIQLTGERHRVGELGMMRQPDPRKPDVTAITA